MVHHKNKIQQDSLKVFVVVNGQVRQINKAIVKDIEWMQYHRFQSITGTSFQWDESNCPIFNRYDKENNIIWIDYEPLLPRQLFPLFMGSDLVHEIESGNGRRYQQFLNDKKEGKGEKVDRISFLETYKEVGFSQIKNA